jgi:hypothetical protein
MSGSLRSDVACKAVDRGIFECEYDDFECEAVFKTGVIESL